MAEVTEHVSAVLADRYRIERRLGEGGMAFLYYVMPYIQGETLRGKLDRDQLRAKLKR